VRMSEDAKVTRDVEATVIPAGNRILIPEGVTVTITQSLGGAYTVITPQGYMARVDGRDADALGKEVEAAPAAPCPDGRPCDREAVERGVWDQLRRVYDPEIPVNIVDLGLIYGCTLAEVERGFRVEVQMTMTAPGCGMGDVLKADAESRIRTVAGVDEAIVEIVWDPPWDQSRMSESARLELGFF
jgi:probable FeS assembly SUF system protein SufT